MSLKDVEVEANNGKNRRNIMYEEKYEDVAQSTEPVETKSYTQAELDEYVNNRVDEILPKKIARERRKLDREYKDKLSKYEEAELVLNAGLGTDDISEATDNLRRFYTSKGVEIPQYQPSLYNEDDMKILADSEAQRIIGYGIEDVTEEVNRLTDKGFDNMTDREKLVFKSLVEHRDDYNNKKELAKIGVTMEALEDADYKEFAKDLNPNLSVKEKYEKYLKYKPKKNIEQIGSIKSYTDKDTGVKEFYTPEEARRFTKADYDKNPDLFAAVERSMLKW
jgi:hypothetical protein